MTLTRIALSAAAAAIGLNLGCASKRSDVLFEAPLTGPLPITINGAGPYSFGLDTGQSVPLLVSPTLARELSLPVLQKIQVSDGVSPAESTVDLVGVEAAACGAATFRNAHAIAMDASANGRTDLDGTAGFPLFAGGLLTLDGPGERVWFAPGTLPRANGADLLDYLLERELPHVPIEIGPLKVNAVLDSGSDAELLVPLRLAKDLPLTAPPVVVGKMATLFAEMDIHEARLDGQVRIGRHVHDRPLLRFADYFEEVNVGRGLLRNYRVTFDQANRRVRFERAKS